MTAQYFYCTQCNKKVSTFLKLFDTLYDFSTISPKNCPACGEARELHVSLDFQLGVGDGDFKVVHAFLPEKLESWLGEEAQEVTFYPFLVVLEDARRQAVQLDAVLARGGKGRSFRAACALPGLYPV